MKKEKGKLVSTQKVFRAGNSLVVAIPAHFRSLLGIKKGDRVKLETNQEKQTITYHFPFLRQLRLIKREK